MSKSLPAIIRESTEIVQEIIENDGELPASLELAMIENEQDLAAKIDSYAWILSECVARADFLKARMKELDQIVERLERTDEQMKERLLLAMTTLGLNEISGNDTKFKLVSGNPICVIEDLEKIDPAYIVSKTTTSPDKKRIVEDLKLSIPVAGARLEYGKSLRRSVNSSTKKVSAK